MDEQFKKIQSLITLDECLFSMQSFDYPTLWQQQFLHSFLFLNKILRKEHSDIIRELHSATDKSLQSIADGYIYFSLLNAETSDHLLKYMRILKVEVWNMIDKSLLTLLKDYSHQIKEGYLFNLHRLYSQLMGYNACSVPLLCQIIKFIDPYRDHKYASSLKLIECFEATLHTQRNTLTHSVCLIYFQQLFLKAVHLYKFELFRKPCLLQLIEGLWEIDAQKCSTLKDDVLNQLQAVTKRDRPPILQRILMHLTESLKDYVEPYSVRMRMLSITLPRREQSILQYILQNQSATTTSYQLAWLFSEWQSLGIQYGLMLVDIAACISLGTDSIRQRIYLLEWVCKVAESVNSAVYEQVRRSILNRWYRMSTTIEPYLTSIYFLKHLLYKNAKMADELLTHVFLNGRQHLEAIRKILAAAHNNDYLRFEEITQHELLSSGIKEQLSKLIMGGHRDAQPSGISLSYPPEQPTIEKKHSMDDISYDHPQLFIPVKIPQEKFTLKLDEQFVNSLGTHLTDLLDDPTVPNFHLFLKKVYEVARHESDEEINLIYQEAARVLYVMFNHEFEDFTLPVEQNQSIIYQMLQVVATDWYQTTKKLVILKAIVKTLCEMFPTAQVAIWKGFLTCFQAGGASSRKLKEWLIPPQKVSSVIPSIQCLSGQRQQTLRKRALKYGIQ